MSSSADIEITVQKTERMALLIPAALILLIVLVAVVWSRNVDIDWYQGFLISSSAVSAAAEKVIRSTLSPALAGASVAVNLSLGYLAYLGITSYYYKMVADVVRPVKSSYWTWLACVSKSLIGAVFFAATELATNLMASSGTILPWGASPLSVLWWFGPDTSMSLLSNLSGVNVGLLVEFTIQAYFARRLMGLSTTMALAVALVPAIVPTLLRFTII
jgi:hypothetical protein